MSEEFLPSSYALTWRRGGNKTICRLIIRGKKTGRPSKRIRLNQRGLKVTNADISYHHKKAEVDIEVSRINHLPTREEVRLHASADLFPGAYVIGLEFESKMSPEDYDRLAASGGQKKQLPWRQYFPSVDEAYARDSAEITLSYGESESKV